MPGSNHVQGDNTAVTPGALVAALDTFAATLDDQPADVFATEEVQAAVVHLSRLLDIRTEEGRTVAKTAGQSAPSPTACSVPTDRLTTP